jgi:integrase
MRYGGACASAGCGASARRAVARDGALSRKRKRARLPRHLRRESRTSFAVTARHCLGSFTLSVLVPRILRVLACAGRPGAPKRQARELLTAVTYVGQQRRGPHARGQRLMALYACMYFAALRPGEAVALRRQDCCLPASGWGRLTLEKSRPEVNRRWTDTASAHDERGLKHRSVSETRRVPIPPELVTILRHIDTFGIAADGRIFSSDRGHPVASTAISDVWAAARNPCPDTRAGCLKPGRAPLRPAPRGCIAMAERGGAPASGRRARRAQRRSAAPGLRQVPR